MNEATPRTVHHLLPGETFAGQPSYVTPVNNATTGRERYVGRTDGGERVFVRCELAYKPPRVDAMGVIHWTETIDHRNVLGCMRLSFSGCRIEKGQQDAWTFGQIDFSADEFETGVPDVPPAILRKIERLWTTKHLSDMHAECIHQERGAHVVPGSGRWLTNCQWDEMVAEQTARCPVGYQYGSAWLLDELTEDDIRDAREIIDVLSTQPEYTGN
jgi:hypothetical protein